MTVFIVVSIIVLVGVAVAATLGRFGHTDLQMHPPVSSAGGWRAEDAGPLRVSDLHNIRFDTAVRGYRMDQVDAMIARLQAGQAAGAAESTETVHDGRDGYDDSDGLDVTGAVDTPDDPGPTARVHRFKPRDPDEA